MRGFLVSAFVACLAAFLFAAPKPASALPAKAALNYSDADAGVVQEVKKYKYKRGRYYNRGRNYDKGRYYKRGRNYNRGRCFNPNFDFETEAVWRNLRPGLFCWPP